MSGGEVELRLTGDEALVLSDLLGRWIDRDKRKIYSALWRTMRKSGRSTL